MISPQTINDRFGKIERPYPWERGKMTICIAAAAGGLFDQRVILCSDRKLSGPFGSAETADKELYLAPGVRCLTAGYESDIKALTKILKDKLSGSRTDEASLTVAIKAALRDRKNEKADDFVSAKFGVTYEFFLNSGKTLFPDSTFRETLTKIDQLELGAELVIAGLSAYGVPMIVETNSHGEYSVRDSFGLAGEARFLATSVLLQREINSDTPFTEALYAVYEAKRYAQKISSVGDYTQIAIVEWDSEKKQTEYHSIRGDGLDYLESLYQKYGPKKFDETKARDRSELFYE